MRMQVRMDTHEESSLPAASDEDYTAPNHGLVAKRWMDFWKGTQESVPLR